MFAASRNACNEKNNSRVQLNGDNYIIVYTPVMRETNIIKRGELDGKTVSGSFWTSRLDIEINRRERNEQIVSTVFATSYNKKKQLVFAINEHEDENIFKYNAEVYINPNKGLDLNPCSEIDQQNYVSDLRTLITVN